MKDYSFSLTRTVNVSIDEFIKIPATSFAQAEKALEILTSESDFEYQHNWSISEEYDEDLRQTEHVDTDENRCDTLHEFAGCLEYAGLDDEQILELLSEFPPPMDFFRFLTEEQKAEALALINGDLKGEDTAAFMALVYASEEAECEADNPPPSAAELAAEARYQEFKEKLILHRDAPQPYVVAQNLGIGIKELTDFVARYNRETGSDVG
jgi:hypothetical protein